MSSPADFDPTRIINKHSATANAVPSLSTLEIDDQLVGLYKGEIAVNHYSNGTLLSSVGLFIRVGATTTEEVSDKLVRIGPAFVTNDLTTTTAPTLTNLTNPNLNLAGQLWLRTTDSAVFIHNSIGWQRVTPLAATASTAGLVRLATEADLNAEVSNRVLTPALLESWRDNKKLISEKESAFSFYVDCYSGDDSVENDGRDLYRPFKTIERALLEVAKVSYLPDAGTGSRDYYANSTVFVGIGDYVVDNRPGSALVSEILSSAADSTGPIQPISVGTITSYDLTTQTLLLSGEVTEELTVGTQLFSSGGGKAVIEAQLETGYKLKSVSGSWLPTLTVRVSQHRVYNSITGGVIVPRGCSIVGADLRKTRIRPKYVGDFAAWEDDSGCFGTGRTSIFKLTGGSHCTAFTFTDNLNILSTHHLCTCVEFASSDELSNSTSGYYSKVFKGLGATVSPAMLATNLAAVLEESSIVSPTISSTELDPNGFTAVNSVVGSSPYVFNCSVLSRFGLCGMLVDGAKATGFRSMVTAQFTNVSLQVDPRAFENDTATPGGKRYKELWRHFSFKACNNGYIQIVSCFVVGSAIHYQTVDGGEMSITNSCSNFGDLSLVSNGYSINILPQDTGGTITKLIRPKPLSLTPVEIPTLPFVAANSTTTKLYLEGDLAEERIAPFTFVGGDTLYVNDGEGTEYTAKLSATAPFFAQDSNGWYFITQATSNGIYTNRALINLFPISIKRIVDERSQDDRIYWLKLEGLTSDSQRRPLENFVLRFNQTLMSKTLTRSLFVAAVKTTDSAGVNLASGTYLIALLSADGNNDLTENIYPPIAVNAPLENSATSLTYKAMQTLLTALEISQAEQSALLVASNSEATIPVTIRPDFARPSLIRCSMHTWEWQGYMNYSSALPKFQQKVLSFTDSMKRIKVETEGGRVYSTGMDQDGNFIVGNKVIDLKTGNEKALNGANTDSQVFKKLTVTERLLMFPNSTLDLRSTKLSIDSRTRFTSPITTNSLTYATTEQPGFIEIATDAEISLGTDKLRAVTPAQLPIFVSNKLSALIKSIVTIRLSPFADTAVPTKSGSSTSLFLHPYGGSEISVYDSTAQQWILLSLTNPDSPMQFNLTTIGAVVPDSNYDIYAYNLGTYETPVIGLQAVVWTNNTTPPLRSTKDGAIVKGSSPAHRFIGVVRTTISGTTAIQLGGVKVTSGDMTPAVCYVANLFNQYDITLKYFFGNGWNSIWWGQNTWAVPPTYGVNAQCRFVLATSALVTSFLDIYSNKDVSIPNTAVGSVVYVAPGINSTLNPPDDAFYGEASYNNSTANSNWVRTLSSGYNFIQYLYLQSEGNLVNEHPAHGMIVTTKV